jgi:outer membrane protein TolC
MIVTLFIVRSRAFQRGVALGLLFSSLLIYAQETIDYEIGPTPAVESSEQGSVTEMPIDLAAALRLADEQNLDIALYYEDVEQASMDLSSARYLALPTIRAGGSYNRHSGPLQETSGQVIDVNRDSRYLGLGSGAVGAGNPQLAGIALEVDIADAVFEPLVAKQQLSAARAASVVNRHNVLLQVASAYYRLVQKHAELSIANQSLRRAEDLARLTGDFAEIGQGLVADAELASLQQKINEQRVAMASEMANSAAVELAWLLHLSNDVHLVPADESMPVLSLFEGDETVDELITAAISNRPDVGQQNALIEAAEEEVNAAKYGPLIPRVSASYSVGNFGGSSGSGIDDVASREDFLLMLYWQLDNLGLSDRNEYKRNRSSLKQAEIQKDKVLDQINSEIRNIFMRVKTNRQLLSLSEAAVMHARGAYELNRQRIYDNAGLPLEALAAMQALAEAERTHIEAIVNLNISQIQLHTALGNPVSGPAQQP